MRLSDFIDSPILKWTHAGKRGSEVRLIVDNKEIGFFRSVLRGQDSLTNTPIYEIHSGLSKDYKGMGLGQLGYKIIIADVTKRLKGLAVPSGVFEPGGSSTQSIRVWKRLRSKGMIIPQKVQVSNHKFEAYKVK